MLNYRRWAFTGVFFLALVVTQTARGEEIKIGYIDSQRIFSGYTGTQEAQNKFEEEVKKWEADATSMRNEILDLEKELQSQSAFITPEKKQEKEALIEEKKARLEEFVNDIWGNEGKVFKRNTELTQPIIEKINRILERIGREEDYSMILDAANGQIVFAIPELDLTDRVIEEINKKDDLNP
jgi:outer membrane protein